MKWPEISFNLKTKSTTQLSTFILKTTINEFKSFVMKNLIAQNKWCKNVPEGGNLCLLDTLMSKSERILRLYLVND